MGRRDRRKGSKKRAAAKRVFLLGRQMRMKAEAICKAAGVRHDTCRRIVERGIESVDRGRGPRRNRKGAAAN